MAVGRFVIASLTGRARYFDVGTSRWLSQDPIGFAAGDANLYRYVGNGPTMLSDPDGLEAVGHHYVPQALWDLFGFDFEIASEVFDSDQAKILTESMLELGNGHNNTAHGYKTGYSGHVADQMECELGKFMTGREKSRGMSKQRQKEFAEQFLNHIKNQPAGTYIADFNEAVQNGRRGQRAFRDKLKGGYLLPSGNAPSVNVVEGRVRVPLKNKAVRYGGRAVRIVPAVGFVLVYNSAIASGATRKEAIARATLDEFTCSEDIHAAMDYAGSHYASAMHWSFDAHRSRTNDLYLNQSIDGPPLTAGGRPIK